MAARVQHSGLLVVSDWFASLLPTQVSFEEDPDQYDTSASAQALAQRVQASIRLGERLRATDAALVCDPSFVAKTLERQKPTRWEDTVAGADAPMGTF